MATKAEREAKKNLKAIIARNDRIRAEHAEYRAMILALRPGWDLGKLELVQHTWGVKGDGTPGLHDIYTAVVEFDKLNARFGK